ncbi:MAG: CusA/CzcA family heavy metal efflux RND transporter, partial [Actinobacteria bacterium]|nr:CusA/CzcA family heavy metal efflux RND transporter [Actinomycetota bacterium]
MFTNFIITTSIRLRIAVVVLSILVAVIGIRSLAALPIDAVPDITTKQVQINTLAPAFGPEEVEKLVTFPIESVLSGIPGLEGSRSISRSGFSQVTVVFEESTDIYFARQQVAERLAQAGETLPDGVNPQMGPLSTGLGEVYMWSVDFTHPHGPQKGSKDGSPGWQSDGSFLTPEGERLNDAVALGAYLRTVQDWIIKPQIRNVAGVAGVDSIGGYEKQYVVSPDSSKLASYGLSFVDLADALEKSSVAVGANFVERGGEAFLVKADARVRSIDDISHAVVATRGGLPVSVRDVATVTIGGGLRSGAASINGEDAVVGTALMLVGENSRTVAKAVAARLADINRALPPGIEAKPVYDRSNLVNATIKTVAKNLAEGALLVIVVLFLVLGNIRAALIAALVIPLSMLMTATGMNGLHVSGNLMSLGALDFGLIVDGAVIIVENCLRRLAERQHEQGRLLNLSERLDEVTAATREMIKPTVYGQAIIFIVYAPLLSFSGIEGKMFTPMAITVMIALAAAFVLSLTFVPAMIALLVRGRVSEKEGRIMGGARRVYLPALRQAVKRPAPAIFFSLGVFAVSLVIFSQMGREFMPKLDERDLMVQALRIPSTSLDQSQRMQRVVENAIKSVPEVATVFSKTGTAEVASDP